MSSPLFQANRQARPHPRWLPCPRCGGILPHSAPFLRRLWRTWGPDLLHCYDIPALPPDTLRLEGVVGSLHRRQGRSSGVASTRPLRAFGQFQVLFAADTEAELLDQSRTVPYAQYVVHRRCVAEGKAGRQHQWPLHRTPAGTITALLQQHATRRDVLAATLPPPALINTG